MTAPLTPIPFHKLMLGYYWARLKGLDWQNLPHNVEVVLVALKDEDIGLPPEMYVSLGGTANDQSLSLYDFFQRLEPPEIAP